VRSNFLSTLRRREPLAYNRATADNQFWTEHWASETLTHLLEVAETSPLTGFVSSYVRTGRRVLEGGCGLGQYVRYFGRQGVDIVGVDFSGPAIARHREEFPDSDVREADLEALPFEDGSIDVYISLGVIEHAEHGAAAILSEARRVLAADGDLLLSTPYLNLSRRLLRRRIEREQQAARDAGASFYQYAFDAPTLDAILAEAGFRVVERFRYDPGRGVRDVRSLIARGRASARRVNAQNASPRHRGRLVRSLLYSPPVLATFAHMQIVSARRAR
jgi:SAM-dependent methyltransferase